jgi:hypothetical protein
MRGGCTVDSRFEERAKGVRDEPRALEQHRRRDAVVAAQCNGERAFSGEKI